MADLETAAWEEFQEEGEPHTAQGPVSIRIDQEMEEEAKARPELVLWLLQEGVSRFGQDEVG